MTIPTTFPLTWCRDQFPGLRRTVAKHPVAFFDGPGGSQVPQRVIDAVGHYMAHTNANRGGQYASKEYRQILKTEPGRFKGMSSLNDKSIHKQLVQVPRRLAPQVRIVLISSLH